MRYVIGVDPGDSTGVALFRDGTFVKAFQGAALDAIDLVELMLRHVKPEDSVHVAVERFTSARHGPMTHQPTAQRVNGAIEKLCREFGGKFIEQGPSDARQLITNERLRELGLWQRGDDVGMPDANDANSAIRHALLRMATVHATDFQRLVGLNNDRESGT